jgi:heterodisulfide reductase subunit C
MVHLDLDMHGFLLGDGESLQFGFNGSYNEYFGCFSGDVRCRKGACTEEIVKASLKPITKPAVKVAPKTPAKKPVAVKVSEVTEKPSEQELIKEKVKIMVKEKATEKAANPTPVVTKKAEPSSISFEDIKKHLLKPLPTIVPSFLRK